MPLSHQGLLVSIGTMTLFITFGISLIGLLALFTLKHWEQRLGVVFFPAVRAKADRAITRLVVASEHGISRLLRAFSRRVIVAGLHRLTLLILALLQWIERKLLAAVRAIRGRERHMREHPPSKSFLHRIQREHKNSGRPHRDFDA